MPAITSVANRPYPLRIAGCVAWYDFSKTATITDAGSGAVSDVIDFSGGGKPLAQASARPTTGTRTKNSLNVIDFDGTDDFLLSANITLAQPFTVFVVALNDDGADSADERYFSAATTAILMGKRTVNTWGISAGTVVAGGGVDTAAHIHSIQANGASSIGRCDGTQLWATNAGTNGFSAEGIRLGRTNAAGSNYWDGYIAEVIVYNSALSAGDIALVEAYLGSKWAIPIVTPAFVAARGATVSSSNVSSIAVDLAAAGSVTVGNYLVAHVAMNNTGTSGVALTLTASDPRNGAWTILGPSNQTAGAASDGATAWIAYVKVTAAMTNGDDVTFSCTPNTTTSCIGIDEFSGINAVTPVAVAAVTAQGSSTTPSVAITATSINQLVYGALAIEGLDADTYTADSDTTLGSWANLTRASNDTGVGGSSMRSEASYKILTGGGAQTWNQTITSRDWATLVVVFGNA